MPVQRYMALCLGHPQYGYYRTRDPLGRAGDFITAPEISQMFGELIGLWAATVWMEMDRPAAFVLAELGPGRGTLMADALRAAQRAPGFTAACSVVLVETSPVLREKQAQALAGSGVAVSFAGEVLELPEGAPLIIIANEFFDALPVRQIVRGEAGWHERCVGLDEAGALCFGLDRNPVSGLSLPGAPGDVREFCAEGQRIAGVLGVRLKASGGAALIIDYGHSRSAAGETLQAVRAHRYEDVLACPGEADITAHVDFEALAAAARRSGVDVHPLLTQGTLLGRLGLGRRAEQLAAAQPVRAVEIAAAALRLGGRDDGQMGGLFKALCLSARLDAPPPAFDVADPLLQEGTP